MTCRKVLSLLFCLALLSGLVLPTVGASALQDPPPACPITL